jgi:hypothetical protein
MPNVEASDELGLSATVTLITRSFCFAWPEYDNESGGLTELATRRVETPADTPDPLKTGDSILHSPLHSCKRKDTN